MPLQRNGSGCIELLAIHVVLALLLIEFALFLSSGVLILLVLGHQIVHIRLCFGEFPLIRYAAIAFSAAMLDDIDTQTCRKE